MKYFLLFSLTGCLLLSFTGKLFQVSDQKTSAVFTASEPENKGSIHLVAFSESEHADSVPNELMQELTDSLSLGKRGNYKLEMQYFSGDSTYVRLRLFSKKDGKWLLNQEQDVVVNPIVSFDPAFSDYNNDGFNDLTFQSEIAARGANELRSLLLFNPKKKTLDLIRNSNHYPNLLYNKTLHCLDAMAYYGGSSTRFLKIEGDSLREFAGVSSSGGIREVYTIDRKGQQTIIRRDSIADEDQFIRYSNFKPLKE